MSPADANASGRALALFDAIVDLPDAERQARLAQVAGEDAALAAELARLLAADDQSSGVLDRGVKGIAPTLVGELAGELAGTAPGSLAPGVQVGAFTLQRPLGSGGMGEVWLARREDGQFVQDVALKLLKRGMDSDEIARRFVRERRILAELNHPHIARLIDGGTTPDGRLYYAMEYVDGQPITAWARDRALSVRDRVQLVVTVCDAVAHAQSRLVVHRDLKPSNVLVDVNGQPRVLDFGIAKLIGDATADTALTASGLRLLSPSYAAPEQVLDEPISTATDVYALGVMLYELLTGVLPHRRSGSLAALAAEVRDEQARAPSLALRRGDTTTGATTTGLDRQRLAREVAGDLDVIVLTALQREPARRYAGAAALAADLRRWLEHRPIAAQVDTAGYRIRKFVTRNRLAVGSASAVLLALVGGLGVALWQASVARDQAALARSEAARAEAHAAAAEEATDRAKRVKDFMMQTFVQADTLRQAADAPTTVAEAFDDALKRIDTELADDPKLRIDVLDDFGEIRAGQGRFDDARALVERALALAEQTYPADHPVIAESLVNRAVINNYSGGSNEAIGADLERAVAILEAHADTEPLGLANALSALAFLYERTARREQALAACQRALELWRQHGKPGHEGLPIALHNVATALLNLGRHAEAEPLSRESIEAMTAVGGPDTPRLEPLMGTLSTILYRKGDLAAAREINLRRHDLLKARFEGPHPWLAAVLMDLGDQAMESQPDEAARYLDEAVAMYTTLGHPRVLSALRSRGLLARDQAGNAAALPHFDAGLAECRRLELDHAMCDLLRANRAGILAQMGDGSTAMAEAEAALASLRAKSEEHDNDYAQALEAKASAHHALDQPAEAVATQQEAVAIYIRVFGEQHPEVARARANLEKLR